MITYLTGDATKPNVPGPKIIAHITNDEGGWGAGFVLALNKLSSEPKKMYKSMYNYWTMRNKLLFIPLGTVNYARVNHDLYVANMTAQHRTITSVNKPICYKSVEHCLRNVSEFARREGATIHMPRIGCGLAGGNWSVIESIIDDVLYHENVFVYDLP
jgi:O-acetyl-ADP-ribose deacetylase (regulator of RNase III)